MGSVMSAITKTIPISQFNRGLAGKIFEDVRKTGAKVVIKNNSAECVLLSPEEYENLMNEVYDAKLLTIASERLSHYDPSALIPQKELLRQLNITEEALSVLPEVELE